MTPAKRLAAVGLAAVLAAGPFAALPSPASAATPGYVAIVVDGHTTACVKYTSGITGDAVLNAAATVHYRNDGLIDAIDNYPSPPHADNTHYWSYWHDTSASWSYSSLGASSYKPKAGSVEGWRFDNGSDPAPAPSEAASGLYAKLCGAHDKSAGSASGGSRSGGTSTGGASGPRTSASTGGVAVKHASGTTGTHKYHPRAHLDPTSTSAGASTSPRASRTAAGSSGAPSSVSTSAGRSSSAPDESSPTASASSSAVAAAPIASVDASPAAESSSGGASGSLTSVLVGLGLVLVLGVGATVVVLRRRAGVE